MKDVFNSLGKEIKSINKLDGCRFDYDGGWILIRRSGTSPFLRISGESNINMDSSIEMNNIVSERMKKIGLI
jgi:phosphomannomutase